MFQTLPALLITFLYINTNRSIVLGIVNLHPETANPIFYKRTPPAINATAWKSGISCLNKVTQFYFIGNYTRAENVVVGSAFNLTTPAAEIQDGYLDAMNQILENQILENKRRRTYQLRVISDFQPYKKRQKQPEGTLLLADFYTIVIDSVPRLMNLINNSVSLMNSWNPGARFLILYNNVENRREHDITAKIYESLLKRFYIHRITILFAINDFDYSLTSLDYFSKSACKQIISRKFDTCRNGRLERSEADLKAEMQKMQSHVDAFNCSFNVCATIAAPFVERDCETGLELRIIGFIRKRLHLNINTICKRLSRGEPEANDAWGGLLGSLQAGDCDFILGGYFPDNEVAAAFWTTDCYYDDKHTWFIKRAEERPEWMAMYSIFNKQTWLCFLLMLPITWLSWYFLMILLPEPKSHKEFSLIGINNMALTICVAVNERPLCHAVRIFWFALALYGMNIISIYTSRLISVFANPGYLHQIDNIREVIENGIPFGGSPESHDWFDNEEDELINSTYKETEEFEPNTENFQAVAKGQRVILSGRMYVMQHNISAQVFGFPQNVFSSPLQMIMKPGFPFMHEINGLIRKMRDMGFVAKYTDNFHFNNTYLNRIAKMRPDFPEAEIVITTKHLQGCFALLILGLLSSCLIFLLETCLLKRNKVVVKENHRKLQKNKRNSEIKNNKPDMEKSARMKIKRKKSVESKRKTKFVAFMHAKFGNLSPSYKEQFRFTPVHRRKVLSNFGAISGNDFFSYYKNRKYY